MNFRNPTILSCVAIAFCLLLFAASPASSAQQTVGARIAMFPFDNLSDDKNATVHVMSVLASRLRDMGVKLEDGESIEEFLVAEGVREAGYVSSDVAIKAASKLGVEAVMVGSVVQYSAKEDDNPEVAFSVRLVDTSQGNILWANYVSVRGSDFAGILGLGKVTTIKELVPKSVDIFLRTFSTAPAQSGKRSAYRIAVMPFENKSGVRKVSMEATYMFMVELFGNPDFQVKEYGEVRQKIIDLRVRERGELNYKTLQSFAEALEVDGILVGTVELYSSGVGSSSPPKVEIAARLIDARIEGVLWTDTYQLSGEKSVIAFTWDKTVPVETVAFGVVAELVDRMEKSIWY